MDVANVMEFRDDYPTCEETFVTLVVASRKMHWGLISASLGMEPTRLNETAKALNPSVPYLWMFCTQGLVESKDARRHLWYLFSKLEEIEGSLQDLRDHGCRTEISCFWVSASGHGGPLIDSKTASQLAAYGLDLSFDFFDGSMEEEAGCEPC